MTLRVSLVVIGLISPLTANTRCCPGPMRITPLHEARKNETSASCAGHDNARISPADNNYRGVA
jgi:hypothetical protein